MKNEELLLGWRLVVRTTGWFADTLHVGALPRCAQISLDAQYHLIVPRFPAQTGISVQSEDRTRVLSSFGGPCKWTHGKKRDVT